MHFARELFNKYMHNMIQLGSPCQLGPWIYIDYAHTMRVIYKWEWAMMTWGLLGPMSGKDRHLVTNEPVEFKTSGESPIILEESKEYTSNEWKQNRKMSTCNQLDL